MGCSSLDQSKIKYRKGLWSPEEDQKLKDYVLNHGHDCWSAVAIKAGLQRNGKSCRLRWINYLRPGLKRGLFTPEEEDIVLRLHSLLGNKWSQIASHLPGRTDNEVKNHWNSYLKKKAEKADSRASRESPESTELSSGDSIIEQKPFQKVLFAEWLPEENAGDGNLGDLAPPPGMRRQSSAATVEEVLPAGGYYSHMGDTGFFGEFSQQFDPDGQFSGCGIFDFLPMQEFSSNL